jgi:hypothetical protein
MPKIWLIFRHEVCTARVVGVLGGHSGRVVSVDQRSLRGGSTQQHLHHAGGSRGGEEDPRCTVYRAGRATESG